MKDSLVSRNIFIQTKEEKGLLLGDTWTAPGSGKAGKKQGGSSNGFCLSGWSSSFSGHCNLSPLLPWLSSFLAQILKELISLIWFIIISLLGRHPRGSSARLTNNFRAHTVYSLTMPPCPTMHKESSRAAFLNSSIINMMLGVTGAISNIFQGPLVTCRSVFRKSSSLFRKLRTTS